jgi:hypothetical protein
LPTQLTTLADLEGWLNITPGANPAVDDLLTRLITAVSAAIESYLCRTIGEASYSRTFNGKGGQALVLPEYPVLSVSSVTIGITSVPASPGPQQAGFVFDQYAVYLCGYAFERGLQNVSIAWTAGYASVPDDIEQACIQLCASRFREKDRIDEGSKVIQGMQVSYRISDIPPSVRLMLQPYRKVVPV